MIKMLKSKLHYKYYKKENNDFLVYFIHLLDLLNLYEKNKFNSI
jgi:hypothetical protein